MTNLTTTSISTKANKDSEAVDTALTLNWEGMTEDDLRALAQQALIVKLQANWRKNSIPSEATVNVVDHKVGTRAPRTAKELDIGSLTAEQKQALVEKLMASLA